MGQIFEKKYTLNTFDFDKNHKLKPMTMMNFLQDISTDHFESATAHLTREVLNGLWVIIEWQVDFDEMPMEVMDLIIKTEPTYFRKFIAYRRYLMEDNKGHKIGTAISKWAYINPETRRQSNLPKILNEIFDVDINAIKPDKFEFADMMDAEDTNSLRISVFSDIDVNRHVNNVTYIKWAIDTLKSAFFERYRLAKLKVSFKQEVLEGDEVVVNTKVRETTKSAVSQHKIFNCDQVLCVQIEMDWK